MSQTNFFQIKQLSRLVADQRNVPKKHFISMKKNKKDLLVFCNNRVVPKLFIAPNFCFDSLRAITSHHRGSTFLLLIIKICQ
jgi:hypothetical protein